MTLLEYLKQLAPEGEVIHLGNQGQIVVNKKSFTKSLDREEISPDIRCALFTAINSFIYKDARWEYDAPCRLTPEAQKELRQELLTLTPEQTSILDSTEIISDPEVFKLQTYARRPYYRLRGKPVTEQQAMDIIRRTDQIFIDIKEAMGPDYVGGECIENCWLITKNYSTNGFGWCHPDGTIGCNAITATKYPDWDYIMAETIRYKMAFPYLDFIIALTDWNEMPKYAWEDESDTNFGNEQNDSKYHDFLDNIAYAIWVHDNKIELLGPNRGKATYQKYVMLYGLELENTSKYTHFYYEDKSPCDQEEYSKQCFKLNGIDPKQVYNKQSKVHIGRV